MHRPNFNAPNINMIKKFSILEIILRADERNKVGQTLIRFLMLNVQTLSSFLRRTEREHESLTVDADSHCNEMIVQLMDF